MITVCPRRSSCAISRRVRGFVVAAAVPVGSEIVVALVAFQHPVGRHQDGGRDRDLGPAHPTSEAAPVAMAMITQLARQSRP
jgi:hypothetical protein